MKYRWLIALLLVAAAGGGLWFSLPEAPSSVREGDRLTQFSLPDLQGATQTLQAGEVILLNFWATWCPPCRKEMPSMIELHKKLASEGLKIVAVSVDKDRDALLGFMEEYKMPFQVLHDAESAAARKYGVFRFPESFLIDRQGKIRHHLVGEVEWMSEPVFDTVMQLLSEPAEKINRETRGVANEEGGSAPG